MSLLSSDPPAGPGAPGWWENVRSVLAASVPAAAVVVLPERVAAAWPGSGYADVAALRQALGPAFVAFWSGSGVAGPGLARAVEFWARFHAVKAVLAGVLLVALVVPGRRAWRAWVWSGSAPGRVVAAVSGAGVGALGVLALLALVANVQGAVAPFASLLGMLPATAGSDGSAVVVQAREELRAGVRSPQLDAVLGDFVTYHLVLVLLGAAVTCALLVALGVLGRAWWRVRRGVNAGGGRVREPGRGGPAGVLRERRGLGFVAVAVAVVAGFFAVVTVANVTTVISPVPALLALVEDLAAGA